MKSSYFWFSQGCKVFFSLPTLILLGAQLGFCGLAIQLGIDHFQTVLLTLALWSLPSQMILVTMFASGASLLATFLAVTFSSIRLMLMSAALVAEIKTPKTRTWQLLLLSHFIAITSWVYTMEKIENIPREYRTIYYAGVGSTITFSNTLLTALLYPAVANLPNILLNTLFFVAPTYFLYSLWRSAQDKTLYCALLAGLLLGPIISQWLPELDILVAGLVGGTIAFLSRKFWIPLPAKEDINNA